MEISKAELEVMNVIWEHSTCTANDVIRHLNEAGQEWHDKTVKTLLTRLVKKQALGFEKEQRLYRYFPLIDQASYQQQESDSFIQRLFGGRVSPLIAGFAKQNKLTDDDIKELKQLVTDLEKNSHLEGDNEGEKQND
jgi:predicted transcriptional regulator